MIALLGILSGIAVGLACGGSTRGIAGIDLRWGGLAVALFIAQGIARGRLPGTRETSAGLWLWVVVSTLLLVVLAQSFSHVGVPPMLAGIGMNLLAVLLNGGMPVNIGVFSERAGGTLAAHGGFYLRMTPNSLAPCIGDVFIMQFLGQRLVFSPGDLLLVVGCVALIVDGMLARPAAVRPAN